MTPSVVLIGSSSVTLTVVGANFVQGSTVVWKGSAIATTFVSSTQLTASIPSSALSGSPGDIAVTVTNPAPGGGSSPSVSVVLEYPQPAIQALSPNGVVLGSSSFTLTVNGSNFASGALVYWNGSSRPTTFVSATQLTATIPASDVALSSATTASVTVQNPSPSAAASNASNFNIENPAPLISSISPSSVLAGSRAAVTVNGSGFLSGASIQLAGTSIPTTYSSSTQLFANIPTTLIGDVGVTVTNPFPSAGASNALTLSLVAGGKGVTLTPTSIDPAGNFVPFSPTGGFHGLIGSNGRFFAFGNYLRDTCLGTLNNCVPATISYVDGSVYNPVRSVDAVTVDGQYVASTLITSSGSVPQGDIEFSTTCIGVGSGCTLNTQVLGPPQDLLSVGSISATGRFLFYFYGVRPPWSSSLNSSAYIYDTCVGAAPGCNQTSLGLDPGNTSVSTAPNTSSDGRYAVYSENELPNSQVLLRDTCIGATQGCSPTTQVLSDTSTNCSSPFISADAQWVAYNCLEANGWQIFVVNTCISSPSCTLSPTQISSDGSNDYVLGISGDGRYVTYYGPNMLGGYMLAGQMIYVYDTCNGAASACTPQAAPVCLNAEGAVADTDCYGGQTSGDGKYININSQATNLISLPSGVNGASYIAVNPLQ